MFTYVFKYKFEVLVKTKINQKKERILEILGFV